MRCIYKKIHNLTFDFDIWVMVEYPLHHVTYVPAKFEGTMSSGIGEDLITRKYIIWPLTLTFGVKATRNVVQFSLHYVNYVPVKFKVARFNI